MTRPFKDILDAGGRHPPGFLHPHRPSRVGAFTAGYLRDVLTLRGALAGVGGDVTGYRVPASLRVSYGSPVSFHVFVRVRRAQQDHAHVH